MTPSQAISYGRLVPGHYDEDESVYEVEHEEFYTITDTNGFKYYRVDIQNTDIYKLKKIIDGCEAVENACWDAQEKFYDYFTGRDLLVYSVHNNRIVGFQLLSYWVIDRYIVVGFDETMVIRDYRGKHLGFAMCALSARTLYIKFSKKKKMKYVLLSITPNPKIIKGMHKYKLLFKTMVNSFQPDKDLMMIHDKLLFRKRASLVHEDFPFFFKEVFPGSLPQCPVKTEFPSKLEKIIPPGIDFFERGDAFIFMTIFSKLSCIPGITFVMFMCFGKNYFLNKKVGLMNKANLNYRFNANPLVEE